MRPRAFILGAAIALIPGVQTGTALAYTNFQLNAVNEYRELYDPNECELPAAASGPGTPGSSTAGNDNAVTAYKFFIGKGLAPFRAAAIIGNLMQESHVNPKSDNPAAKDGGGGIAQWEGPRWNGSASLNAFASGSEDFGRTGSYAGENFPGPWDNIMVQLNYMWWEAGHTRKSALTALKAATNIQAATEQWELKYEGAGDPQMDKRIQYAIDALNDPRMGNRAPGNGPPDTTADPTPGSYGSTGPGTNIANPDCTISNSGTGGTITQTALSQLSWPTDNCVQDAYGEHRGNCHDYTKAYHTAIVKPDNYDAYTDCGIFVSTVMHVSKADPNYPLVGTTPNQHPYVQAHPELYQIIKGPRSTSQLKSGDILISYGHTEIYVGNDGGKYPRVDASWGTHTPERGSLGGVMWMLSEPGIIAAHYIGPQANAIPATAGATGP